MSLKRLKPEDLEDFIDEVVARWPVASRTARQLVKNYEMWHEKGVRQVQEKKFTFPKELFRAGRAVEIVYSSDKWEKDGDNFDYSHSYGSGVSVYRAKPKVGAARDTCKLLHVDDLNGTIPMVQLAYVKELVVENDGERWPLVFARPPMLVTLLDLRTLVILHRDPIFIRGGKMVVRAPGITN